MHLSEDAVAIHLLSGLNSRPHTIDLTSGYKSTRELSLKSMKEGNRKPNEWTDQTMDPFSTSKM